MIACVAPVGTEQLNVKPRQLQTLRPLTTWTCVTDGALDSLQQSAVLGAVRDTWRGVGLESQLPTGHQTSGPRVGAQLG